MEPDRSRSGAGALGEGGAEAGAVPSARGGNVVSWAQRITENELPLFAQSLAEISSVASARQSSASDLARAISVDVAMSVRLLRIANSPVLNPQERPIDSVRTAVVMMGFEAVRDLAFSLALVTEMQPGEHDGRVATLLAHAFHTAALAQALAGADNDRYPEEVFVAGLLLDMGAMAFWSRARPETDAIEARMARGEPARTAEQAILGFTLRELSRRLADSWGMGGLLRAALSGTPDSVRGNTVLQADALAHVLESHGWDSAEANATIDELAQRLQLPLADARELVQSATRAAGKIARQFGIRAVARILAPALVAAKPDGRLPPLPAPDPSRELAALQALQDEIQGKPDLDRLMRLALEGLHGGVGMDRVAMALLSADRHRLRVRYAAGADRDALLRDGVFGVSDDRRTLFGILLDTGKAVWVDADRRRSLGGLIDADLDAWAQGGPFFAMPIVVNGRALGMLYADRCASGRVLDEAAFASFRLFGSQLAAALTRR